MEETMKPMVLALLCCLLIGCVEGPNTRGVYTVTKIQYSTAVNSDEIYITVNDEIGEKSFVYDKRPNPLPKVGEKWEFDEYCLPIKKVSAEAETSK